MITRRRMIKGGAGLAAILATQSAPAIIVRSMVAARNGIAAAKRLSAKSYVQDGLIAMWDGIENAGWGVHDDSVLTMVDLISNVATITFTESKDGKWFYNQAWKNTYISALNISAEEYTLECVVMKPTDEPASPRYYPVATIASGEGQYVSWKPSNDLARMNVGVRDSETATNTYKTWSDLASGFTESIVCDMAQTIGIGYVNGELGGKKIISTSREEQCHLCGLTGIPLLRGLQTFASTHAHSPPPR